MVELKTPAEIAALREAGRVVAQALEAVRIAADVGVSLKDLDDVAAAVLRDAGATSAFDGYHPDWAPTPFAGVICASVNDAVVHGIPGGYRLADGDLVSIDFGAFLRGWCGDAAISFIVGTPDPADQALIDATDRALQLGIKAAHSGAKLGDIGAAVGNFARSEGYGILADHGGHGVGRAMHEEPHVPNESRAGRGMKLRSGLVIAIEPMLIADGTDGYYHDEDGWTLRTISRARAAHSEHTIAITDDGPLILTAP